MINLSATYEKDSLFSSITRDRIFVKGYVLSSFVRNMRKSIGNNIGKNVSSKYVLKLLDHAMMHLKLFQKQQFKKQ